MSKPDFLTTPRFTQPEVLRVSGLRADTLQTWINRKLITLADHNPGTGRRRLYSPLEVCLLTIMGEIVAFGVGVSRALEIAVEAMEQTRAASDWRNFREHTYVVISAPDRRREPGKSIVRSSLPGRAPYRDDDFNTEVYSGDPKALNLHAILGPDLVSLGVYQRPILVLPAGSLVATVLRDLLLMLPDKMQENPSND